MVIKSVFLASWPNVEFTKSGLTKLDLSLTSISEGPVLWEVEAGGKGRDERISVKILINLNLLGTLTQLRSCPGSTEGIPRGLRDPQRRKHTG